MASSRKQEKGPGDYAREALSQWGDAVRYGAAAVAAKRRQRASDGGSIGALVERIRPHGEEGDDASLATVELPIQESIDIAIPIGAVYALCVQFEEFPEFLDRVESVEAGEGRALTVVAKVGGRVRELAIEIVDERPDQRIDWECGEGFEHSGVISLHPLAPRLTRLELTVERQPEGLTERVARRLRLPQRTIEEELHRFKAYAELWEEAEEYETEEELEAEGEQESEEEEEAEEEEEPEEEAEAEEEPEEEEPEPAEARQ